MVQCHWQWHSIKLPTQVSIPIYQHYHHVFLLPNEPTPYTSIEWRIQNSKDILNRTIIDRVDICVTCSISALRNSSITIY